jgi:IS30 family transposase
VTDNDIANIQNLLNNRPRKSLGFATPNEVFDKMHNQAAS